MVKNFHAVSIVLAVSSALRAVAAAFFHLAGIVLNETRVDSRKLIHEEFPCDMSPRR